MLLVLASVAAGARLLAAADDTVAVWQVERDIAAGLPITVDDLTTTQVHFSDAAAAARYLPAGEALPSDARLASGVSAGELLKRSSVALPPSDPAQELPLDVAGGGMPSDLQAGQRVAVWAVPAADSGPPGPSLVLDDTLVLSVGAAGPGGAASERVVLLELPADSSVARVAGVLSAVNGSSVVLVRTG